MNRMKNVQIKIVAGNSLQLHRGATADLGGQETCRLIGMAKNGEQADLVLSDEIISRHVLILGSVGTGKTNAFYSLMNFIKPRLGPKDAMIVFDTKGDFLKYYSEENDVILSAHAIDGYTNSARWNVFDELGMDADTEDAALEISKTIFADSIRKSSNPFFPKAAAELFAAILLSLKAEYPYPDNWHIRQILQNFTLDTMHDFLEANAPYKGILSYIPKDAKAQAQGVLSELKQAVQPLFSGDFAEQFGEFSVRDFVRKKGGRTLFIEYDLGIGNTLTPLYQLLYDLAIKETLCRDRTEGNVYFLVDEFRLLPCLQHIADGINFGRSLGAKFILGLQNVSQMYEEYGEHAARSILSGLSTLMAFRLNDPVSREYVSSYLGENIKEYSYHSRVQSRGRVEAPMQRAKVVEEWIIQRLRAGEAIIALPEEQPFIFRFNITKPNMA